ncbi:MAG: hypothetical protein N2513_09800 [Deltaproteobacteria bacterium]|nr:hypothetical protein [Deltaproteobacteria bacterium]
MASFEYMIQKMKGQDMYTVRQIFEEYTGHSISSEEAEEIFRKLNETKKTIMSDIVYEAEAAMGRILMKSIYGASGDRYIVPPTLRRGDIGFTSTNHTGEDQIVVFYPEDALPIEVPSCVDNTALFGIMCRYFGIRYENPKIGRKEAKTYIKPIGFADWKKHLELHVT